MNVCCFLGARQIIMLFVDNQRTRARIQTKNICLQDLLKSTFLFVKLTSTFLDGPTRSQ